MHTCVIFSLSKDAQSHNLLYSVSTYTNLLDLCKAANVFFPEFFVPAEDLPTQRCSLLVLFLANQVTEVLHTDALHNPTKNNRS